MPPLPREANEASAARKPRDSGPRLWRDVVTASTTRNSIPAPKAAPPLQQLPTSVRNTLEALEKMASVKNTFIDLRHWDSDLASGGQRRTASSPPTLRSVGSVSTDVSDNSSEVSDGYAATFDSDRDSMLDPDETFCVACPVVAVVAAPPVLQPPLGKLSSTAKPWRPTSSGSNVGMVPLAQLTQLSGAFATAMEPAVRVVTAVASKMGTICSSASVSVSQQPDGWMIIATLKNDEAWHAQKLLEAAQASLVNTCEISQRVVVVSCKPLAQNEHGFRAILGLVDDRSKACWDIFTSIGCTRGARCNWEHPRFMRRLDVAVTFHDEIIDCSSQGPA